MTTREQLIEAMGSKSGALSSCDCEDCLGLRLDAVLPLIADAIERVRDVDFAEAMAEPDVECEYTSRECHANASHAAYSVAARLVRQLGQDGE